MSRNALRQGDQGDSGDPSIESGAIVRASTNPANDYGNYASAGISNPEAKTRLAGGKEAGAGSTTLPICAELEERVPQVPLVPLRHGRSTDRDEVVRELAESLMRQHGLVGWKFEFDRAKVRLGCCHHRTRKITVARFHAQHDPLEQVRDTILHEIAHALCGCREGHGPAWKAKAVEVGARPERCASAIGLRSQARKWRGTCQRCGMVCLRHRRQELYCGECTARSGRHHWIKWARNRGAP